MCILVIGADHLGDIENNLKSMGCQSLTHVKGRNYLHRRSLQIPKGTDLVLVMTDFVNHNISCSIREKAKSLSIPIIFSKRSWSYIFKKLKMVKGLSG